MISRADTARMANSPWRTNALIQHRHGFPERTEDLAVIAANRPEFDALRQRRRDHQAERELRAATREAWQQ